MAANNFDEVEDPGFEWQKMVADHVVKVLQERGEPITEELVKKTVLEYIDEVALRDKLRMLENRPVSVEMLGEVNCPQVVEQSLGTRFRALVNNAFVLGADAIVEVFKRIKERSYE